MLTITRSPYNPILKPNRETSWEAEGVFNGCPIKVGRTTHLFYRALSMSHFHALAGAHIKVSDIGHAESKNGHTFSKRERFIVPEKPWELFGCEDPRVTKFRGKYYIFYTALSKYPFTPDGISVGLAISKDLKSVTSKHHVTPFNSKAMALFPGPVNGKMCAILTVNTDRPPAKITIASFRREEDIWSHDYWNKWYDKLDNNAVPLLRKPEDHIEVGAPPLATRFGWLLLYSYIRNYRSGNKIFGIEAALLDRRDPRKVLARSEAPLLVPDEEYELYGNVPNIVFPSGALVEKGKLNIYYGATDTTCCLASVPLEQLLKSLKEATKPSITFSRFSGNPIIYPDSRHVWETKATFNPGAIYAKGKVHLVYRAMDQEGKSVLGYAASRDGLHFTERLDEPIYVPRESFELKSQPGNSGCEDPRLTLLGGTIYMCYTAYDGKNEPRVGLTSISLQNFLAHRWMWEKPVLISPPEIGNKDACVFPGKVNGKYLIFHRMGHDMDIALVNSLKFDGKTWLEERRWLRPRPWSWDSHKVGVAAPPVKTKAGWVLLYHGVSAFDNGYRVGALLLNSKQPTEIIGRTPRPLFEPTAPYEKNGQISNVVFPCGNVVIGPKLYIYYGGADQVVGVATIQINELLKTLR